MGCGRSSTGGNTVQKKEVVKLEKEDKKEAPKEVPKEDSNKNTLEFTYKDHDSGNPVTVKLEAGKKWLISELKPKDSEDCEKKTYLLYSTGKPKHVKEDVDTTLPRQADKWNENLLKECSKCGQNVVKISFDEVHDCKGTYTARCNTCMVEVIFDYNGPQSK